MFICLLIFFTFQKKKKNADESQVLMFTYVIEPRVNPLFEFFIAEIFSSTDL